MNEENTQPKKTPLENLRDFSPKPNEYDPKDVRNLTGLFETVSAAPTGYPKTFWGSIKIYENGSTYRLYIYSEGSKTWRYVTLT